MNKYILLILLTAFFLRIHNIGYPSFTADEARIAKRGYNLYSDGEDELGRKYPLVFNSIFDYQLPLTSYVTSVGVGFFGKSDLGVRLPFILIGTLTVLLSYMIAGVFDPARNFRLLVALSVAFSPVLIFLSKVPNDTILLTFLFLLLFYNLTFEKFSLFTTILISILLLLTSKIAWFTLTPFTFFTPFIFRKDISKKSIFTLVLCLLLTITVVVLFLQIPQSVRSLKENNFALFSSETVKNGIDKLRGQGIESGWPPMLERVLFNKLDYLFVGFLHTLSSLQPAIFFAQFDSTGRYGFVQMGAWSKVLIIPFIFGLINMIKNENKIRSFIPWFFLIFTYPLFFIYPLNFPNILAMFMPFMALIIAKGLLTFNKLFRNLTIAFMIFEVVLSFAYTETQIKSTNALRPAWIEVIAQDAYFFSKQRLVLISDDIVDDVAAFIQWYTPAQLTSNFSKVDFPYRFRLYEFSNIKLIGFDNTFRNCSADEVVTLILSVRDIEKIRKIFEVVIEETYKDSLNRSVAFRLNNKICIN